MARIISSNTENSRLSILHIEDNPGDARLLKETLDEVGDFDISLVGTLAAALLALENNQPAVILLDLSLPDAKGLEAIARLREAAGDTPVIAFTGFDDNEMARKILQAGAQDYLIKGQANAQALYRAIVFAIERNALYLKSILKREKEINELEVALGFQQQLTGWQTGSHTAVAAGVGPLHLRIPELFNIFQADYEALLDAYLEALAMRKSSPRRQISELAERLGDQGGGPRDVVDIHLKAVEIKGRDSNSQRTRAYALEGRLLALEVMGYLVDYYRLGRSRAKK